MTAETVGQRASPSRFWASSGALVGRMLIRLRRIPTILIPATVMPAFFMIAFTGSFEGIAAVDGFPTDNFVSWVAPFALVQSASFAGVGAAAALALDLENGFVDRLLLSPIHRVTILLGVLGLAVVRALVPVAVVLALAAVQGAEMPGGIAGIALAVFGGIGVAVMVGAIGVAVVTKAGDTRAVALVQVIVFALLFPTNGQVPLALIEGWIHHVARFNPATHIIRMTRQGFIGEITWADTWPGLLVIGAVLVVFGLLAEQELRRRRDVG